MCVYKYIKPKQTKKNAADRPTDRPAARAASVPRSVGRSAEFFFVRFGLFIKKHTYSMKNIHITVKKYRDLSILSEALNFESCQYQEFCFEP